MVIFLLTSLWLSVLNDACFEDVFVAYMRSHHRSSKGVIAWTYKGKLSGAALKFRSVYSNRYVTINQRDLLHAPSLGTPYSATDVC